MRKPTINKVSLLKANSHYAIGIGIGWGVFRYYADLKGVQLPSEGVVSIMSTILSNIAALGGVVIPLVGVNLYELFWRAKADHDDGDEPPDEPED